MSKLFLLLISALLNRMSLQWIQRIGGVLGRLFYLVAKKQRQRLQENLNQTGFYSSEQLLQEAVRQNQREMGKYILESLAIWSRSQAQVLQWIRRVHGIDCIDEAIQHGKGVIFLTPHLGCFEIASIYFGSMGPITVLNRDARKSWIRDFIRDGRRKGAVSLASTDLKGVRLMLKALYANQSVGILPDQVASKGQGEWADFFGKPVYTMTLVGQLIKRVDSRVIVVVAERLSHGEGFDLHFRPVNSEAVSTPSALNQTITSSIKQYPLQYMWSYDRYKQSL